MGSEYMIPEKMFYSRKEIAEMLCVPTRKVTYITERYKIKPKTHACANHGGKKNLYTLAAVKKIKEILQERRP
jgi:hypothetical protein